MTLNDQLARLAAFEPSPYPVISLYLDTQPDGRGRDHYQTFVRKELKARAQTYPQRSPEREMLDRDMERIASYLENSVEPSANGIAIFACDAAELFEAVQFDAPLGDHWLYVGDTPHLYPLARVASQYPRYAVVLADTCRTRILVMAAGGVAADTAVEGPKTRRTSQGGWSQARYQRHVENYHLQHVKDVAATLERIVMREGIDRVIVSGDPVVIPLLREQLSKSLAGKVVDELTIPSDAPEADVLAATRGSIMEADAKTDREKVDAAIGAYRAGGLGVVGPDATLLALTNGQVDELLITASLASLEGLRGTRAAEMAIANDTAIAEPAVEPSAAGEPAAAEMGTVRLADELVTKAQQTAARISFIEDPSLLEAYGGVAATLRYRI
ncbi:MAG TPA: Vms1/Ankzf1 family peptidyl-tRNA hydrolase [Vicinamibacterales bacterium]|nr:Vms1/Ankzf1 family peptidyl-tRNA hydrolase [Vicinamibacterales bacterium]